MDNIFKPAIKFGESEFAWKKQDIPKIVNVLIKQNKAIIGAEVWVLTKGKKIKELYWYDFEIKDKRDSESWSDYVIQTSAQFLQSFNFIKDNKRINEEREVEGGDIYFNLSFVGEDEYQNLQSFL